MSYVAMDTCIYCKESKGILLDRRLKNDTFPEKNIITSYEPCDKCKNNMSLGFTFIEHNGKNPTDNYWVIKMDKAKELLKEDFLTQAKDNITYIEPSMAIELGLCN